MGIYVYGFVRRADLAGDAIVEGDLAALTRRVEGERVPLSRDAALEHAEVLSAALERGPVLPLRFGHVMPDEEAVRLHIASRTDELERLLAELEDRVEMDVTAVYREEPLLREVLAENPALAAAQRAIRGRPEAATHFERIRLGEGVAAAVEAKRAADGAAILHELQGAAVAVSADPPRHERMLVNAAFLVQRDRLPEFDDRVERVSRDRAERMEFRLVGPRPAHSFV
jgi:hypothetical protein